MPLGRRADAQEVAYPILWLALDEASYVNGSVLMVYGGQFTKSDNSGRTKGST